jgi:hypothetical protein
VRTLQPKRGLEKIYNIIQNVFSDIPIYCWDWKRFFLLVVIVGVIVGIVVTQAVEDDRRHC